MSIQKEPQNPSLTSLIPRPVVHALIYSILLFVQVGCTKQLGQYPCSANECFGQDIWQEAIDQIAVHNFPEKQFHGRVYSDPLNNAWTTNDNNVNISEDLLSKLIYMGDAYVLSVSAHEIAHIQSNHYSRKAALSHVSSLGSLITDPFSYLEDEHKIAAMLSRKHELEADMLAIQYMENAGHHGEDYLKFLKWMARNLKDASQSDLATHPPIKERIARVEELISSLKGSSE